MPPTPIVKTTFKIFDLPDNSTKAGQVFYGVMLSGILLLPIVFTAYPRFVEPAIALTSREFFFGIYCRLLSRIFFLFCSGFKSNSTIAQKPNSRNGERRGNTCTDGG